MIGQAEAERKAAAFVTEHFGGDVVRTEAVHQSDRLLYGYLSKNKLADDYEKRYDADYPADTYQVEVRSTAAADRSERIRFVHLHMETGEVVAWDEVDGGPGSERSRLSAAEAILAAKAFLQERGYEASRVQLPVSPGKGGYVEAAVTGEQIGGAPLKLRILPIGSEDGQVRIASFKPAFEVPADYAAYVERQDRLAMILTMAGSLLPSFILFVLAVVYAALYRSHTSFLRGLVLTAIFLAAYLYNNVNLIDGVRASAGEAAGIDAEVRIGVAISQLFTVGMAVSVYFSFVGGDGLWRSMKRNLWPRWGEAGYGSHVWQSMKIGYWFAFIILGLQTVILIALERGLGVWSTTDVTQSPLNMAHAWLFPLLAWCAAISEEAVFRHFGIAVFRKWFRNTYAAAVIPTVVWALGHVAYPIYPAETRLIELTLLGFVFCWLFLRFGLIAAIFAHAVMNTILMSISLVLLGTAGNIAAAAVYIALPLLIAWVIRTADRNRRKPRPAPAL